MECSIFCFYMVMASLAKEFIAADEKRVLARCCLLEFVMWNRTQWTPVPLAQEGNMSSGNSLFKMENCLSTVWMPRKKEDGTFGPKDKTFTVHFSLPGGHVTAGHMLDASCFGHTCMYLFCGFRTFSAVWCAVWWLQVSVWFVLKLTFQEK